MPKRLLGIYGLNIAVLLFTLAYVITSTWRVGGVLITHYDLMRGIDFLGSRMDFYMILFEVFFMSALNFFMSLMLYSRIRFLSYLFAWVTLFLNVLTFVGVSYLISLNI